MVFFSSSIVKLIFSLIIIRPLLANLHYTANYTAAQVKFHLELKNFKSREYSPPTSGVTPVKCRVKFALDPR